MPNYNVKPNPAKRKAGPMTEAEKQTARDLLAAGKPVTAVAREIGVGMSTISRLRKIEGLSAIPIHDNRAGSRAFARQAAVARNERLAGMDEIYRLQQDKILKVLRGEAKYRTILKGAMGVELEVDLDFIPPADLRSEISALATLDTSINRNDDKADDGGQARAKSMLDMVLQGIAKAAVAVPAEQAEFEE